MARSFFHIYLLWIAAISAAACSALPTPPPSAATQWLRVETAANLSNQASIFSACTPPDYGLVLQQAPGASFDPQQADLRLSWGQPVGEDFQGYAAELFMEELVVVVNPSNPISSIQLSALRLVYTGRLPDWDWDYLGQQPGQLTAYAYPLSSTIQHIVNSGILAEGESYDREVAQAPGPQEMLAAIAQDAGGIGFLPSRWVDERVKTVALEGETPETWQQPVLAISNHEPQGAARDWLLCVQERLK